MILIDYLTPEEKKLFKSVILKREQILFHENDICEYVGIVISGVVSISSFSYNGNEIVFNKLKSGDIFGNNLLFTDNPYFKGNIIAKTKAEIALINKKNLIKVLQENVQFLEHFQEYQSVFSQHLNSKIKLLSFDSAEERFLYYLFINKNKVVFETVTSLAAELSIKRETLSRLLTKLSNKKVIYRKKNLVGKL